MKINNMFKKIFLLLILCLSISCSRYKSDPQIEPYENLLTIVADFNSHMYDDIYRFPYPRDVAGQNLYKATVVRLLNYKTLNSGKYDEIIYFKTAQAYERIGNYTNAIEMYNKVIEGKGKLKDEAQKRLPTIEEFHSIIDSPLNTDSLGEYLSSLEGRIANIEELSKKYKNTEYEPIALVELENAEIEYSLFLDANKYIIKDGINKALNQFDKMTKKFANSKNIYQHYLNLGDFYMRMAKEFAAIYSPESIDFNLEEFNKYIDSARKYYLIVEQADGSDEKPEANAKLSALASFSQKIRKLAK